jgi:hypothetical protein
MAISPAVGCRQSAGNLRARPYPLFTVAEPVPDLQLYAAVLDQTRVRGDIAAEFLEPPLSYPRLELAALQMRIMLELIPLGGLLTHRQNVEEVASAFRLKDADAAAKLLKRVNPNYWPKPVVQVPTPEGPTRDRLDDVTDGFVTEMQWKAEWGFLSSVLHARNTYKGEPELPPLHERLCALLGRIVRLIGLHILELPGDQRRVLGMVKGEDGVAHVNELAWLGPVPQD